MACSTTAVGSSTALWDSTPIGRSIDLRLCQQESLSPQLIIEEKVFRTAIRAQNRSIVYFIGTLIADDESQRLTYVIDRSSAGEARSNGIDDHQLLTGEFPVPMQCNHQSSNALDALIQSAIQDMNSYCYSSLPVELHRFTYLCGQMCIRQSSSVNIDLSFDLITIQNSFALTPINSTCVQISPTALLKSLTSATGNTPYQQQAHFGYCSLDRTSVKRILLLLENDPQACTLPLVGIWVSGITDIQCSFVWAACLRYCLNASLKQRLRSGIAQSFLLACYLSTSHGQCDFYEVSIAATNSAPSSAIQYDLWRCAKQINIPHLPSNPFDTSASAEFPYDFEFQRVRNISKLHTLLQTHPASTSIPIPTISNTRSPAIHSPRLTDCPPSTNPNTSLFGFPRLPPQQSTIPQPSWDVLSAAPMLTTPKRLTQSPIASPVPSPNPADDRWKGELIERMQSYEAQFLSLTNLVRELVNAQQQQQTSLSTPRKQCARRDVAVQSEPSSPYINDDMHESISTVKSNHRTTPGSKSESHQFSQPSPISTDRNPVDILKPIFQYIDNQQRKQQHTPPTAAAASLETDEEDTSVIHSSSNPIQQQHVTSTRTTGISFISNGVQMQFINQQSSTTTVYPQSQPNGPSIEPLPTSPHKSENNLSVEVHALEMKYLEDDQLAAAIECNRQPPAAAAAVPPSSQITDKSLSFETQEYLQRYGLFPVVNK